MVQVWHFFFPAKEGGCLVLETISLDHRNKPTGLLEFWSAIHRSRPKVFSRAILFHFDAKFWYYVVGVHNSPREGLFVINFMPFTQGLWMAFVCHKNNSSGVSRRSTPLLPKYLEFSVIYSLQSHFCGLSSSQPCEACRHGDFGQAFNERLKNFTHKLYFFLLSSMRSQ